MGRKRFNYTFTEARILARGEVLTSYQKYIDWWDLNKPSRMPRRPDRAYEKEFLTWNDFLGNSNVFPTKRIKLRPFVEARVFAQRLKLKNKAEWIRYARDDKSKPNDIPARPDLDYRKSGEWYTWADFLGYKVTHKLTAIHESNNIFFILSYSDTPLNVYRFGVTNGGMSALREEQRKVGFKIVKAFECESQFQWHNIIRQSCYEYDKSMIDNVYVVPNFYDTLDDLESSNRLDEVRD